MKVKLKNKIKSLVHFKEKLLLDDQITLDSIDKDILFIDSNFSVECKVERITLFLKVFGKQKNYSLKLNNFHEDPLSKGITKCNFQVEDSTFDQLQRDLSVSRI